MKSLLRPTQSKGKGNLSPEGCTTSSGNRSSGTQQANIRPSPRRRRGPSPRPPAPRRAPPPALQPPPPAGPSRPPPIWRGPRGRAAPPPSRGPGAEMATGSAGTRGGSYAEPRRAARDAAGCGVSGRGAADPPGGRERRDEAGQGRRQSRAYLRGWRGRSARRGQRRRPGASAEPPPLGAAPDGAPPPAPREQPPPASPVPGGRSPAQPYRGEGKRGAPLWRHRLPCPDLQSPRGTGRPREEPQRAGFASPQPIVPPETRSCPSLLPP